MDIFTLRAFIKEASQAFTGDDAPADYFPVRSIIMSRFPGITKIAWDWHKFREGITDEGIPLTGATIGAFAARPGQGLRGAALGYAAGSGISLLRSKLKGEKPSLSRKILAASGLGYGLGGLAHGGLERLTTPAKGMAPRGVQKLFHAPLGAAHGTTTRLMQGMEEAIPAAGAILGTGVAMGSHRGKNEQ